MTEASSSAGLSSDETVVGGLMAVLCSALHELVDVGNLFIELVAERFRYPKGKLDLDRETRLFARVSLLVRKMLAFELWLQSGGAADAARVARLEARRARAARKVPVESAAVECGMGERATAQSATPERENGTAPREGRELHPMGDEQAEFEDWFASRTTEDVVTGFQKDLVALARVLGKQLEIVRIDEIVYRIIALIDDVVETRLLLAAGEDAFKPLPFVQEWREAQARRAPDSG